MHFNDQIKRNLSMIFSCIKANPTPVLSVTSPIVINIPTKKLLVG